MGFITNLSDYFKCQIWKPAIPVTIFGIIASVAYSSNVGWILFDMTEHFILRYILISVGFLQCVAVGWFFEYSSTASASEAHAKALKYLSLLYWIPTVVICFYANFGMGENKIIGLALISLFTFIAMFTSYRVSKMNMNSFYHEIILQGVDKLSMSITCLSHPKAKRSSWMLPFETYFGICIKYVNPACLLFILINNLEEDLKAPYNDQTSRMYVYATIPLFLSALIVIVPVFICGDPEIFEHNVNLEFLADNLYEIKLRMNKYLKDQFKNTMQAKLANAFQPKLGSSTNNSNINLLGQSANNPS